MTHRTERLILIFVAGLALCVPRAHGAESSYTNSRLPRVLVLYSNERLLPANIAADGAIRATFKSQLQAPVEFHTEFLDVDRFPGNAQQERTRDFLRDKYRERPPDVVIAGGTPALNFVIRHRATPFTGVPVVHCGVSAENLPQPMPDDLMVGIPSAIGAMKTLELALRLQPETRRVAVVDGGTRGRFTAAEVASLAAKVEFLWLTNRSIADLRRELSQLPDHTVVFYGTMFRDPAGNAFTPQEALDQFAAASRAPIYGYYDTYLGHGIVGGSMITFETMGRVAAEIAIRILKGQKPQDATRGAGHTPTPMFDWHQLQRWDISESRLPSGAEIRFREPSVWKDHNWTILGGIAPCLLEAALIVASVVQLRRRRQAELDRAVDKCHRPEPFTSQRQRVEFLFALHEKVTAPMAAAMSAKPNVGVLANFGIRIELFVNRAGRFATVCPRIHGRR